LSWEILQPEGLCVDMPGGQIAESFEEDVQWTAAGLEKKKFERA